LQTEILINAQITVKVQFKRSNCASMMAAFGATVSELFPKLRRPTGPGIKVWLANCYSRMVKKFK
jgi:hypothetical protein